VERWGAYTGLRVAIAGAIETHGCGVLCRYGVGLSRGEVEASGEVDADWRARTARERWELRSKYNNVHGV